MKLKTILYVSAITLTIPMSAYATSIQSQKNQAVTQDKSVMDNVKEGFHDADEGIKNAAHNVKVFFIGKTNAIKGGPASPTLINNHATINGMIGQPVKSTNGESIASVKDIIIDQNGKEILLVVADHGFLGVGGKVSAFPYKDVVRQDSNGDVIMTLTPDMIARAADFSYDPADWAKAKVIPTGSISMNSILKGNILDSTGKNVATIDNIYFQNGQATHLIVGFNKTLGMGGDSAAFDYDRLQMIKENKNMGFRLTPYQTEEFKNFKTSVNN